MRYIEAVKAAEVVSEKMSIPIDELIDVFADIPTADVVERKRGKWSWEMTSFIGHVFTPIFKCSNCGHMYESYNRDVAPCEGDEDFPNFCENCGADMRGAE